jgi:hypothetical protein
VEAERRRGACAIVTTHSPGMVEAASQPGWRIAALSGGALLPEDVHPDDARVVPLHKQGAHG